MKLIYYEPLEKVVKAVDLIKGFPGIIVTTEVRRDTSCPVVEFSRIENSEFESTVGRSIDRSVTDLYKTSTDGFTCRSIYRYNLVGKSKTEESLTEMGDLVDEVD